MISEFHDLSRKIDQLAEMTQLLRRENAALRQSNKTLSVENEAYRWLLEKAQTRVRELLASLPPEDAAADGALAHDAAAGEPPAHDGAVGAPLAPHSEKAAP